MGLCKYSKIFGNVGEGVHSVRLFNIAVFDLLLTVLLAYFINFKFFKNKYFLRVLLATLLSGIIVHRLFCVNSTINSLIFGKV